MRWSFALPFALALVACDSGPGWKPWDGGADRGRVVDRSGAQPEVGGAADRGPGAETAPAGCKSEKDCASTPATPYCQAMSGKCVPCEEGKPEHACQGGLSCCGQSCVDLQTDPKSCGVCGNACALQNADVECLAGACALKACKPGFLDCDKTTSNGCESQGATCTCAPKSTAPCYTGPVGTEGVGACKGGLKICNDQGTGWGACLGELTPQPDACDNAVDDDCDGTVNNGYPTAPACGCLPKSEQPCYSGPASTAGKGTCKAGKQVCADDGKSWSACEGEVLPQSMDSCLNVEDEDCNGVVNDGFAAGAPGCACTPGDTKVCYTGADGTLGKGTCHAGTQTCDPSATAWGLCSGEVKPSIDICANGLDEDCDGTPDNPPDQDGDGWNACQGDCCDVPLVCGTPGLINPGAFEVAGNSVDDDCDGTVDNAAPLCDTGLASSSGTGLDYARAIDLCQTTVENPTNPADKKWGVISAELVLADGTGTPHSTSRSIRPGFGTALVPKQGSSLAVLSTGNAADLNDSSPSYAGFQVSQGQNKGTASAFPADWLAAHGGALPNAPGCPGIQGGATANDPVMLKLRIRVPTNAQSFSLSTYFFSSEFPEWTCSPYNDFFVVLLNSGWSGTPANPADRNLAFYDPAPDGPPYYPVGVNLATGDTGLFRQCKNGTIGCAWQTAGKINTCVSTAELAGTGFDVTPAWGGKNYGYCNLQDLTGGGTGWLTTKGNVTPGEVIEVRLAIWDTSDHWWDSLVLLDNWIWSVTPSKPGTD